MARLLGRIQDFGSNLAELVAPLEEGDEAGQEYIPALHDGLVDYEETDCSFRPQEVTFESDPSGGLLQLSYGVEVTAANKRQVEASVQTDLAFDVTTAQLSKSDAGGKERDMERLLEVAQSRGEELLVQLETMQRAKAEALQKCAAAEEHSQEERERVDPESTDKRQWEIILAGKEHEIGSLKEVISQLRRSKNSRAAEVDAALKERDEMKVKLTENLSRNQDLEKFRVRDEGVSKTLALFKDQLAEKVRQLKDAEGVETDLRAQLRTERHVLESAQQSGHEARSQLKVAKADLGVAIADKGRALSGLANLQHVIENFQAERDAEVSQILSQRTRNLEAANEALLVQIDHLQVASSAAEETRRAETNFMQRELAVAQQEYSRVADAKEMEISQMRRSLDLAIDQLQTQTSNVVDCGLMRNLLLQYFAKAKSQEVLELIAKILGLSEDDKEKIGLRRKGILRHLITPLPPSELSAEEVQGSNLVELWVAFLEKETNSEATSPPGIEID
mmetsp:Transcript_46237/g.93315  ORF Transcript_46237/g.93315 Transcript_46237/m.93315 type:complete len:507 (-) Transcript_46237:132-1652(-)